MFLHHAFASLRPVLRQLPPDRFPEPEELTRLATEQVLKGGSGAPLRFVRVSTRGPWERPYELRIYEDGEVPTRPQDFHDLFNALAWLAFPQTKALLNRRHYEHRAERGAGTRGTPRDVLTLFDESGVIVACGEPELAELLRCFQWKELFWSRRSAVIQSMRFLCLGHAIHEKVLRPYKALTAKALIVRVPRDFFGESPDAQTAEADRLATLHFSQAEALAATRLLTPLPVLGIPGWDQANEYESFYDDVSVFRPGRRPKSGRMRRL